MLGGPQGIAGSRLDHHQLAQIDAGGQPGLWVRNIGRCDQHNALTERGKPGQARPQQAQFATAIGRDEDFSQGRSRPAAGGQGSVQQRMATGLQADLWRALLTPFPDPALIQQGVQADHRAHHSRRTSPQNTPSMAKS